MVLDSTRVMNGSYGRIFDANGDWLTNVNSFEASVDINKEEVPRSGTRWIGQKVTSLTGTGNLQGYKVTTELIEAVSQVANDRRGSFVTDLYGTLDDPEAFGALRVRLKNVQFDEIDILNFEVNTLVEEEMPFTFEGFELVDTVEGNVQ